MHIFYQTNSKNIIKEIPNMIGKSIHTICSDEQESDRAKDDYNKALEKSDFTHNIKYQKQTRTRRFGKKNTAWFNPLCSQSVKKNVGKICVTLIVKSFQKDHKYHKTLNKYTIELSNSCKSYMSSIITKHNNSLLDKNY